MKKRFLAGLLCLALMLTLLPTIAVAADGEEFAIELGSGSIAPGDYIYYGNYPQSDITGTEKEPVKWQVVSATPNGSKPSNGEVWSAGDGFMLLSDKSLAAEKYNIYQNAETWENCTLRSWLNGYTAANNGAGINYSDNNFINAVFGAKEIGATLQTKLYNPDGYTGAPGGNATTDRLFVLSYDEGKYYFPDDTGFGCDSTPYAASQKGNYETEAWVRTPGSYKVYTVIFSKSWGYNRGGLLCNKAFLVHPAFNLNTDAVLFSSAAVGGKSSGATGAGALKAVENDAAVTDWKLTLKDSSRSDFSASLTNPVAQDYPNNVVVKAGDNISINYSGAKTGSNEYISATIVTPNSKVIYYGNIAQNSSSGTNQQITIPEDLPAGVYEFNVFNEQLNGDKKTDYSSEFKNFLIFVLDANTPTLTAGAVNRISDASATVTFTNNETFAFCYYGYKTVDSGAMAPTFLTEEIGTACDTAEQTITLDNLRAGAKDIYIVAKDRNENVSAVIKLIIPAYVKGMDTIIKGTGALASSSNTSAAATVYYGTDSGGKPYAWRVIGYNGTGAASSSGSMTLISAGNPLQSAFNTADASSAYADSALKTSVEEIAAGLSAGEQMAIVKRTLLSGNYNGEDSDCVAGGEVSNALLWPLSAAEASSMDRNLRIVDLESVNLATSYWWLRSPGYNDYAACVGGDGNMCYHENVSSEYGVRPAFNLDLSSVILSSAAVGGKSANGMDTALTAIPDATPTEWKLTLLGADRDFDATVSEYDSENEIVTVSYSGAKTGANEYVSAIINGKGGSITHYGRLKNITTQADASGTVNIDLSGIDMDGKTLCVFSEQYNGGENDDTKLTDYASKLVKLFDYTAPALTAGAVDRTSDTTVTVKFTSDEAGEYYYAIVKEGESTNIDVTYAGVPCGVEEQTINIDGLTAETRYIYIFVKDASGNGAPLWVDIPAFTLRLTEENELLKFLITEKTKIDDVVLWAEYDETGRMISCKNAASGDTRVMPQTGNRVKAFWLGSNYFPKAGLVCFPAD